MSDVLAIPERMSPSARGARVSGFNARLAGDSRYANPYGDRIDQAQHEHGRAAGWLWMLANAWWLGWHAADQLCGDTP